jgi:molybdopterin converting factor small subunit
MMQIHIKLYGPMRVVAGQADIDLAFDTPSITLAWVIDTLIAAHPRIRPYLLNESGDLQKILRILLNNQRPDPDLTLTSSLHPNDILTFLTPVGGGKSILQ